MNDSYGPQLPTAADVEAADDQAAERWDASLPQLEPGGRRHDAGQGGRAVTVVDQAAKAIDRAAGTLQGTADAAQGTRHHVRAWTAEHHPARREAAARERWHAGQPARNTFERDVYAALENQVRAGMNRLVAQGKQASAMEAAMVSRADPEAGQ